MARLYLGLLCVVTLLLLMIGEDAALEKLPGRPQGQVLKSMKHTVMMEYKTEKDRGAKLQLLLTRWKSILAQKFARTATSIKFVKEEMRGKQHIVNYEVTFTKKSAGAAHIQRKKAVEEMNNSLDSQPIAGVTVYPEPETRGLLAPDMLD
ncbi:uncharacterized protein LOC129599982 [Paramacrobiotus metropolitanus]|uniref:uncharacterized protein LOC129599982 n=1 Tax=Paramacrobiotus metropolitanus TaxID=2943436 RepID=UPI002445F4EA|nr:uncharacterized protein LOC129599982 [Paramacrobiotus metropolitanus]